MNYDFAKKAVFSFFWAALIMDCKAQETGIPTITKPEIIEVVAKVNGVDISALQVKQALQRLPNQDETPSNAVSLRILRTLIDQEVIAQKAVAAQLDQDIAVRTMIDMARRQILAEAYMVRVRGAPVTPTDKEIVAYFDQHPDLFAKRKIYHLQEIWIKAPNARHDAIRARLVGSKMLHDFLEWLQAEKFLMETVQGAKPAEQLPEELLSKFAQFPKGQAAIFDAPDGLRVVVLANTQLQPVTLEQVKSSIVRVLQAQAEQETVKSELDTLKASAKIEYLGKFADSKIRK